MKRFFTVTSPTNSLAVAIYVMFAFYGVVFLFLPPTGPVAVLGTWWSTVLLASSSAAVFATLSAPRRRDPGRSLIIELWASVSLCTLMTWLLVSLFWYRTESGDFPIVTFGIATIFVVAFGARAFQVQHDRRALEKYRREHGLTVK